MVRQSVHLSVHLWVHNAYLYYQPISEKYISTISDIEFRIGKLLSDDLYCRYLAKILKMFFFLRLYYYETCTYLLEYIFDFVEG